MDRDRPKQTAITKAARRLLPFLCLCYVINFLDRVNVGFAALHMNADLGFSPSIYGAGAGIFFVGYILFEVPSNWVLTRVEARIWIARIMVFWGIITVCMMFVKGVTSFYVLRFLLGAADDAESITVENAAVTDGAGTDEADESMRPSAVVAKPAGDGYLSN